MTKEEMEKKRNDLAESGEYSEGESCSFYMNEIEAFKNGWDACAEEYEKEIERLREQLIIAKQGLFTILGQFTDSDEDESYSYPCAECHSFEFAEKALNKIVD